MSGYRKQYMGNWRQKHPWYVAYYGAQQRCDNINHVEYHRYGGRGIRMELTPQEVEFLWNRDKAYLLKKPSIDRIYSDKNYTLDNCRFIELAENTRRAQAKAVIQKAIDGTIIRISPSTHEASRALGIHQGRISGCALGKKRFKTAGGFKWEYLETVNQ